jgi:hypothetical protein
MVLLEVSVGLSMAGSDTALTFGAHIMLQESGNSTGVNL